MRTPPFGVTVTAFWIMFMVWIGLSLSNVAQAATHWVSPTGAASWGSCVGTTPLSGTAACALATANSSAAAGDTVYLRGGTYTFSTSLGAAISPANSGTCATTPCTGGTGATPIVFAAYTGETPVLVQASTANAVIGIALHGVNWIKVTGITFQNFTYYLAFLDAGSSYNEISYNSFTAAPGYEPGGGFIVGGFTGPPWSTHNWIHHNYISKKQDSNPCGEAVDLVRLGNAESNPYAADNYNTLENNYLEYGGHATVETFSKYLVVNNNIAHNEPWISGCTGSVNIPTYDNTAYNGLYGHRNFSIADTDSYDNAYTLVEGNRLGFASVNPGNGGSSGIDLQAPGILTRYNFVYGGMDSGIYFKYAQSYGNGTGGINNRVYNNTLYANGHGWNAGVYGTGNLAYNGEGIAQYSATGADTNNVVKNNLVYGNGYSGQWDICYLGWYPGSNCSPSPLDTVSNNWFTSNGDPKFTNPDMSDPTSQNLVPTAHGYISTPIPNLTLLSSSPAIDGGTYLTTASSAGSSSTTLAVADAAYFQDGSWGSDLARGVTFFPDWIAIGTVTNTVQIGSVNYATNTITLASPMNWSNGAHIWLYKKSDGTQVLYGSAPDYGASEYGATTSGNVVPPSNLQATVN